MIHLNPHCIYNMRVKQLTFELLINIKQLLNSVLVGYEELLRQRFVLFSEAEG